VTKQAPDPTPEEIQAACEEMQRGWSRKQEQKHLVAKPERWQLPVYNVMEISPAVAKLVETLDKMDHIKED
jgi:hypothetical protein